jgi:hypothetical protein
MQIKGLLKNLTDNSLVKVEKIGSGNYYWAFTSDSRALTENKIEGLHAKINQLQEEILQVGTNIETSMLERENLVFTSYALAMGQT